MTKFVFALTLACAACLPSVDVPTDAECAGKFLTRQGGQFKCVELPSAGTGGNPVNISDLSPSNCAVGEVIAFDGTVWTCAQPVDAHVTPITEVECTEGQVPYRNASGVWSCEHVLPAEDAVSIAVLDSVASSKAPVPPVACDNRGVTWHKGDVDGGEWACADFPTTPASTCSPQEVLTWDGAGFKCTQATLTLPPSLTQVTAFFSPSPMRTVAVDGNTVTSASLAVGASAGTEQTNVASGSCVTLTHDFGTHAIGYSAWMTDRAGDGAKWVPAETGDGRNLAFGHPVTSSSPSLGSAAVDGLLDNGWTSTTSANEWLNVDLRASVAVTRIAVQPLSAATGTMTGTNAWELSVSNSPTSFPTHVATGTCASAGECQQRFEFIVDPPAVGRYVRFQSTGNVTAAAASSLAELEVYTAKARITQDVGGNAITLCNDSGEARSLALRAWR